MAQTPVAVLGTLAEFHREPIPYDLAALVRLVNQLQPDLLCLDMTEEQWQQRSFGGLPPEYREALLRLAAQTDIVVVPVAEDPPPSEPAASGWHGRVIAWLRRRLAFLQRTAPGPAAVNARPRHFVADLLYSLIAWLAGRTHRKAWQVHTGHLARRVAAIARRDPDCRVLVVVSVRHCHHLRAALRKQPDIRVVPYEQI